MNDFSKMAKRVSKLADDMGDSLESEIEDGMEATERDVNAEIVGNDSIARKELITSLRVRHLPRGSSEVTRLAVSVPEKYKFVEYGTGYHSERGYKAPDGVPVENILRWIQAKGIQPYAYPTQYALAQEIADVIDTYGNEAHPFMRPAWMRNEPRLKSRGSYAIKKSVRRM